MTDLLVDPLTLVGALRALIHEYMIDPLYAERAPGEVVINVFVPKAWQSVRKIWQLPVYHETDKHVSIFVNYKGKEVLNKEWLVPSTMLRHAEAFFREYEDKNAWAKS